MPDPIVYGNPDARAVEQLKRCADLEEGSPSVLMADSHVGYSQPIGGVVGYRSHLSISGVGYDIACGNKAVRTNLTRGDIEGTVPALMDEVFKRISFGVGLDNDERADHEVLDKIADAAFAPQRGLRDLAWKQLGTVGAGNHYVDLFAEPSTALDYPHPEDPIWIGVHFGSRGFGHKTTTGFLSLANGGGFTEHAPDGEMDAPPTAVKAESELGQAYQAALELAGEYAYAGRDVVVDKVLEILGAEADFEVHNHHNFAWRETHGGEDFWVVRKGATPAAPGQLGFVGATMAEESVILEGTELAEDALFSTVHGAGRVMSRTQAAGKVKRRKKWECNDRDCDYSHTDKGQFACSRHPDAKPIKRWHYEQVKPGEIDFEEVKADLADKRIELRGAAADEAPAAYKRLDEVLAAHGDEIRVLHRLEPLGVAMAPRDTFDPYKD